MSSGWRRVESVDRGYETCVISHADMPNIHAVAASFTGLSDLCRGDRTTGLRLPSAGWLSKLDATGPPTPTATSAGLPSAAVRCLSTAELAVGRVVRPTALPALGRLEDRRLDRLRPGHLSRRRESCHSTAPPSTFITCDNSDGERGSSAVAVGESSVILLHPPLHLLGVSIRISMGVSSK